MKEEREMNRNIGRDNQRTVVDFRSVQCVEAKGKCTVSYAIIENMQ